MDYVRIRTHVIDHARLLEAGPAGRDLWTWGMLWSGEHETDGEIPLAVILVSPWGAGGKANVRVAQRLVEVGLWERTDRGFRVLRWAEQGNKTKAELDVYRAKERAKKTAQRRSSPPPAGPVSEVRPSGCPPGTPLGTPEGVLNSSSSSSSLSEFNDPIETPVAVLPRPEGVPRGSRELRPDEPLTEAREAYVETARMVTGKSFDTATVWRRFVNHWIAASRLFGSEGAIDAAWRNWVDAEPRRGKFPVRADTRQPVQNPENYAWMHAEGSSL